MPARPAPIEEPAAVWVAVADLVPWTNNPRKNAKAIPEVVESIKRFGFASPIIARKADKMVIAGHTRLAAAKALGLDRVPVRYVDLDPADARLLALADNKIGEIADWDDEALAKVLAEMEAEGLDLAGLGWSSEEIEAILADPAPGETSGDDDVPEGRPDAESRPGEVYHLGPHRLVCGDCRDLKVVARLMGDERAAVAFTSPPYASQREYDATSGFKPIPAAEYVDWFDAVQANVRAHLAPDGSWFVNIKAHCEDGARSLYVLDLVARHVREWRWRLVDDLVWLKQGMPGLYGERLKNEHEPVFHFAPSAARVRTRFDDLRAPSVSIPSGSRGTSSALQGVADPFFARIEGMALPGNVVEVAPDSAGVGQHTARFPVGLPAFFVRAFSDPGDIILDPFMGSGTSIIAAAKHGRRGYGVEISPTYCDVIRRRWARWATENGHDPGEGALNAPTV